MRMKLLKILLVTVSLTVLLALAFFQQEVQEHETHTVFSQDGVTVVKEDAQSAAAHLHDNQLLYFQNETDVVTMYLTVGRGNTAENTNHSWQEINAYSVYDYDRMGVERYQIAALLQVGDENGPLPGMLGYGETVPNATVQIRGQSSSLMAQKNYKIEIKKGKGTWNDQRSLALNKHVSDGLRFRNKLAYSVLQEVPQLMSLRTQFVHLYVRDLTGENPNVFMDYGLYTQVEQPNARALKAHGLDENGHMYKINTFEFYRYEDVIRLQTDPLYDQKAFDELLEVKGDFDHTKLIRMLDDLNDISIDTDQLLDTYFDAENLAYWLAFEILIGNTDTQNRNVYLYSPLNSSRWYLLPWDHDGSFKRLENTLVGRTDQGAWEIGVSNYWGNMLFRRCLKSARFRAQLDEAVQTLRALMTEDYLTQKVQTYAQVVKPYLFSQPDAQHAPITAQQYDAVLAALPKEVEENYQLYLESFLRPMPFYIGVPAAENGMISVGWENAFDFDAETITYTVEVADTYLFENVLYSQETLYPQVTLPLPAPGQYFVRVRATNASGYSQYAFDYYVLDTGKAYGMRSFYVMEDGSVEVDVYEED